MKRRRVFLIALLLVLAVQSFAACGGGEGVKVESISIEGAESVTAGTETRFRVIVWSNQDAGTALTQAVVWTVETENGTGAVIDADGVFKAESAGTATVSAAVGGVKQYKEIAVEPISVDAIVIDGADSALVNLPVFFTAEVMPNEAASSVTWAIEGENGIGATISAGGVFRATAQGKVTIAVLAGNAKATKEITVIVAVRSIAIDGPDTIAFGETAQYIATVTPENATYASNAVWAIEGQNMVGAAIDASGNLTATATGKVTISVAAGGKRGFKTVVVTALTESNNSEAIRSEGF